MNTHCPCPNTGCRRYGNCEACREFHASVNSPEYCRQTSRVSPQASGGVNLMDYAACAG